MKKMHWAVPILFSVLLVLGACGGGGGGGDSAIVATYSSPTNDPAGMTFDGTNIWMSGDHDPGAGFQPMFYKIDIATGSLINTILPPVELTSPGGLAYTGTYIAVLDGFDVHYITNGGSWISSLPAPVGLWPTNLAYDGTNFWGSDGFDTVLEFSESGSVISSFTLSGTIPANGLAWDGTHLWVGGAYNPTINRVDTSGNIVGSIDTGIEFPDFKDLAFDGTHLWVVDGLDGTVYKISPD